MTKKSFNIGQRPDEGYAAEFRRRRHSGAGGYHRLDISGPGQFA